MLQTETSKSRREIFDEHKKHSSKYLINKELEWLIEHGKIRESIYFKGATGDRYTIYIATKRNKNVIDIGTVFNSYDHGTSFGTQIAILRGYILEMRERSNQWGSDFYYGLGYSFKQLMRQGVMSKKNPWKIKFCRSAYFCKLRNSTEFVPWKRMKIDIKNGILVNKPNNQSIKAYKKAKDTDFKARKANYKANKNNKDALARYKKAGGNTQVARGRWVNNGQNVSQAALDPTIETMNWDLVPMNDCFKHRNATLRSNIIEHYGMNAIIATLDYDIIDEDTIDNRKYRLLDVLIPDESIVRTDREKGVVGTTHKGLYLEMINPSTGESHFEGIANVGDWGGLSKATVKEALKWRDGDSLVRSGSTFGRANDDKPYITPITLT